MWIKFLYNYSLIISCYLDHLRVEIPSGLCSWHTNPECDQQMVRLVWHLLRHMLLPGEREKGKLQIKYHWLCVCSYAHLKSLRQKLVCNKMLQILGLIYNSLKGNAVSGSWHLLCLNRGDIHIFMYVIVCSFYYVACSQYRMHFAPKMFIILKVKERLPEQMRKEGSCCNGYPLARASWKVPIVESLKYLKNYSINIIHGIINMCGQIDHLPLENTCSVSHTHLTVCGYSLSALPLVESCLTIGWI